MRVWTLVQPGMEVCGIKACDLMTHWHPVAFRFYLSNAITTQIYTYIDENMSCSKDNSLINNVRESGFS